jgi:hypothetical protein
MPTGCFCGLLCIFLFGLNSLCSGQAGPSSKLSSFCKTSLDNQPRPTFFNIQRYRSGSYRMRASNGDDLIIQDNSSISISLRAPLVLRPGFKAFGSLTYYDEDFEFINVERSSDFSQALHNKSLRSLNASLYLIKPFRGNLFILNRWQASLNGDFNRPNTNQYLNFSVASVLGWRKSSNTILGLGLFYGVDFDGSSLVPLFAYQHTFNKHWSMESVLPVQANVRYFSKNRKNILEAGIKLNGPEYNIHLTYPSAVSEQFEFERSEVRWSLHGKREIHDWLWLGLETGFNTPVSTDLRSRDGSGSLNYTYSANFFTMFSLFLGPPQKLLERHLGR